MNKKYIKFNLENLSWDWWLRSAYYCSSYRIGCVFNNGYVNDYNADYHYIVPIAGFEI